MINTDIISKLKENNIKIKYLLAKMEAEEITDPEYQQLQELLIWQYSVQDILTYRKRIQDGDEFYNGSYPICHSKLKSDKLLFISDTHLGHDDENVDYVSEAYNVALRKGIKTVIHAGDLVEGTSRNHEEIEKLDYAEGFNILENEIKRAIGLLPQEIKTKLLLGNHDYSCFRHFPGLISRFFGNENVDILGMGRAIVNWNGSLPMEIVHDISDEMFSENVEADVIQIRGHSHKYEVSYVDKTIWLPTLSEDFRYIPTDLSDYNLTITPLEPVFVEAEMVGEQKALFRQYSKFGKGAAKIESEVEYDIKAKKMQLKRRSY